MPEQPAVKFKVGGRFKVVADSTGQHPERVGTTVRVEHRKEADDEVSYSVITEDGKHSFDVAEADLDEVDKGKRRKRPAGPHHSEEDTAVKGPALTPPANEPAAVDVGDLDEEDAPATVKRPPVGPSHGKPKT